MTLKMEFGGFCLHHDNAPYHFALYVNFWPPIEWLSFHPLPTHKICCCVTSFFS